jgi:hypothetical protein
MWSGDGMPNAKTGTPEAIHLNSSPLEAFLEKASPKTYG